ncbi:MAG TPA: hypothetical protein VM683_02290, partial [Anaeromyxobacteraceae bacterium]|nr:hypothetical protein [Anaeromyxobacteraceae bacterium]
MLRALVAAVALAAGSGPDPAAPAGGQEVERVVAVVRARSSGAPHVITLTRLESETRVALVARGALLAAEGPLDGAARRAGLQARGEAATTAPSWSPDPGWQWPSRSCPYRPTWPSAAPSSCSKQPP